MYTLKCKKGNLHLIKSLEEQLESITVLNVIQEPDFPSRLTCGALFHREDFNYTSGK